MGENPPARAPPTPLAERDSQRGPRTPLPRLSPSLPRIRGRLPGIGPLAPRLADYKSRQPAQLAPSASPRRPRQSPWRLRLRSRPGWAEGRSRGRGRLRGFSRRRRRRQGEFPGSGHIGSIQPQPPGRSASRSRIVRVAAGPCPGPRARCGARHGGHRPGTPLGEGSAGPLRARGAGRGPPCSRRGRGPGCQRRAAGPDAGRLGVTGTRALRIAGRGPRGVGLARLAG